jgi:UDP-2,3-diacylglucosamine pyrophosphatase LpxH
LDGVICGHFHIASLHEDHGLIYANCGDWVDSLTAIAESSDGGLQLLAWQAEGAVAAQDIRILAQGAAR